MIRRFYLGGGIGSGKSSAGDCLRDLGAVVLSGDDAGRAVLGPGTEETAAVLRRWPEVGSAAGTVDRRALGRIVFGDADALAELERITGPGIRRRLMSAIDAHPDEIVIVEVPVLREFAGSDWPWIVVDAPVETCLTRAARRGAGMPEEEVRQIMRRQPSRGEWLAAASWVIDNSGDMDDLRGQCLRVWNQIREL